MTPAEQSLVSLAAAVARVLLQNREILLENDYLWNTGGMSTSITQEDLTSIASFSGLTTTQLTDAMYALSVISGQLTTSLGPLTTLARLVG